MPDSDDCRDSEPKEKGRIKICTEYPKKVATSMTRWHFYKEFAAPCIQAYEDKETAEFFELMWVAWFDRFPLSEEDQADPKAVKKHKRMARDGVCDAAEDLVAEHVYKIRSGPALPQFINWKEDLKLERIREDREFRKRAAFEKAVHEYNNTPEYDRECSPPLYDGYFEW